MAITAQFDADFSQFNAEVGKAEQQLNLFEMSTVKTGTAIAGMGTVTTKTAPGVNTLTSSLRQFDGVLNAAGIHIGPAIKAIEDIGAASGKTAGEVGKLGTAGLIVGTFAAAFTTARWIIDKWFPDLDKAVANSTAKLMGWGDLAAETAGAKMDTLAAATKHLREMTGDATATVTDFGDAVRINNQWLEAHKKGATDAAKAADEWTKATETVRIAMQDHDAVLRTIKGSTVAAATAALEHGVALDTVRTAYKLTESQIAAVEAALKSEQEAAKASEQEHARITAELKTHWDAVLAIRDQALGKDAIEKATQWTEAIFLLGNSVQKLSHEQLVDLQAAMTEAMTAMARNGELTAEQALQFNDFSAAAAAAEAALRPVVEVTNELAAAQTAQAAASGDALAALQSVNDATNTWGLHPGGTAQTSSGAIRSMSDSMGNQFLVNAQTGEIIEALERKFGDSFLGWGPKGPPPTVNLTVEGNVLGTQNELAKLISDSLMWSYGSGGNRLPA